MASTVQKEKIYVDVICPHCKEDITVKVSLQPTDLGIDVEVIDVKATK